MTLVGGRKYAGHTRIIEGDKDGTKAGDDGWQGDVQARTLVAGKDPQNRFLWFLKIASNL